MLGVDALHEIPGDLVRLARRLHLAGVERLERDVAADQLLLEHIEGRLGALLGVGGDDDRLFAGPVDAGVGAAEVVALREFLRGLVEGIVDLLAVDLAHHVKR